MFAKCAAALITTAAITIGGLGVTFAASAGASTTPTIPTTNTPTTKSHCANAQLRVNSIAAHKTAAADRLLVLEAALTSAQAKNRTDRVQKLENAITKVEANQAKFSSRLTAIEQACNVTPA